MSANLTTEELALQLRKSPYTIRRMARNERLPGTRVGREWIFKASEVQRVLNTGRNKASRDLEKADRDLAKLGRVA